MSDPVHIAHAEQDGHGAFTAHIDGISEEAELTYKRLGPDHDGGPDRLAADHTFVPPAFRGRGVAALLVDALIAKARAENAKIVPICSYVVASFDRHPEWADLRAV